MRAQRANILFFGNFVNLREDEFRQGMSELLQNPDALYLSMMRDLYSLGRVLERKFRYLRLSYSIFILALGTGVAAFIFAFTVVVLAKPGGVTP